MKTPDLIIINQNPRMEGKKYENALEGLRDVILKVKS